MSAKSIVSVATAFDQALLQKRLQKISLLTEKLSKIPPKLSNSSHARASRYSLRCHIVALSKAGTGLPQGEQEIKFPKMDEMSSAEWAKVNGPFHLRLLGKSFGIVGPIIPYESEVTHHVKLSFEDKEAKRGNFIQPSEVFWKPQVFLRDLKSDRFYSVLLIDVDYPSECLGKRIELCLWAQINQKFEGSSNNANEKHTFTPNESADLLKAIPPHPSRGSDTHRIVAFVLEHEQPLNKILTDSASTVEHEKSRHTNIKQLLEESEGVRLVGYQFFRTCWTKVVNQFCHKMGIPERIFGEVLVKQGEKSSPYLYN